MQPQPSGTRLDERNETDGCRRRHASRCAELRNQVAARSYDETVDLVLTELAFELGAGEAGPA